MIPEADYFNNKTITMKYFHSLFIRSSQFVFLFILLCLVSACNEQDKKDMANVQSKGNIGDLIIIMDSVRWKGPIGDTLRSIFSGEVPGLLRSEPYFKLTYFHPNVFNSFIKTHRNLIFVTSLQDASPTGQRMRQFFSQKSIESINQDSSIFMLPKQNEFARNQHILHLFGKTDRQLLSNLSRNKEAIRQHFNKIELGRLNSNSFAVENKELSARISKEHGFHMRIPENYALAKSDSNFVWVTFPAKDLTTHVFVAYKSYRSADAFIPENILAWRDSIGYNYMYNQKIKDSYMTYQDYIPPVFRKVSFNDRYAVETRGLWRLKNNSRGGPFLSYTFVDESTNRLYYIEGFLLGPAVEKKREFMRQLEAVLWTFKPTVATTATVPPAS